jgi:hypothetical protein
MNTRVLRLKDFSMNRLLTVAQSYLDCVLTMR